MVPKFQSLLPILKDRIENDLIREVVDETDELIGLPYSYVTPGMDKKDAQYYWDTYFLNLGLIRIRHVDLARHHVENLTFLLRRHGYVPPSSLKSMEHIAELPLLPWMVRDIYRATGDKEWLSRVLPDALTEFRYWTNESHTTPAELYRFTNQQNRQTDSANREQTCLPRCLHPNSPAHHAPVDLNALLYRNAKMIYDLQVEVEGHGDPQLLQKSESIKSRFDLLWDARQQFYFDHHFADNRPSGIKSLAGFLPMFVEIADSERAAQLQQQLASFVAPGGLTLIDQDYVELAGIISRPLLCAPFLYFVVKGLIDYEFMEDAADIGANWLTMVYNVYKRTGEMWQWYNVLEKNTSSPDGSRNHAILGWTAGAYITLVEALGLE
jgi:alpha,alpha-trehalase